MNSGFLQRLKGVIGKVWGTVNDKMGDLGEGILNTVDPRGKVVPFDVSPPVAQPQTQVTTPTPTATSTATPTPTPYPTAAPGTSGAMEFIASQMPSSYQGTPQEYYPALGNQEFMRSIIEADKVRQGLAALLLLQSFFESTLGRGGKNYFGALPQGEGGVSPQFASPTEAVDYQLGPNVLGGGANPNMNILDESTPLDYGDVTKLYQSYNPSGDYLQTLLKVLFPNQ